MYIFLETKRKKEAAPGKGPGSSRKTKEKRGAREPMKSSQLFPQCPFYKDIPVTAGGGLRIMCEGAFEDAYANLFFRRAQSFRAVHDEYCCGRYKECPYYAIVNAKYE